MFKKQLRREIERVEGKDKDGLWFIAVTTAHDVLSTVTDAGEATLTTAVRKFLRRRWGNVHMVVLDKASPIITPELVTGTVTDLQPEDLDPLDVVLLAEGEQATLVWARCAQ